MPNSGRLISICLWQLIATPRASPVWPSGLRSSSLKPIEAVPTTWESMLDVFESTLAHEQKVTSLINNLYALATQELDFATQSMLKWFIDEQVEEEENASTIIDNIRMIKDNGYGLYMLDKELGARVYTQAAPLVGKE